jgi:predicted nucleic acid-binding protein
VSRFVLDASVSGAWFLPDSKVDYAIRVRRRLAAGETALVPGLWSIEMASVLAKAVRKGNLSAADAEAALGQLEILLISGPRIEIDPASAPVWQAYATARTCQVSAYDGVYLELAQREGLAFATLDNGLRAAAVKAGVKVIA